MNKRKKTAMRKHRHRARRLEERRREAVKAGAQIRSKGRMKRLTGDPVPVPPK